MNDEAKLTSSEKERTPAHLLPGLCDCIPFCIPKSATDDDDDKAAGGGFHFHSSVLSPLSRNCHYQPILTLTVVEKDACRRRLAAAARRRGLCTRRAGRVDVFFIEFALRFELF